MVRARGNLKLKRESRVQAFALVGLLLMGGLAVAGPAGFLAWSDNLRMLDQRQQELKQVQIERNDLHNRVTLLDPRNTDPDLAGELLRRNLNVVHQDEMVLLLK